MGSGNKKGIKKAFALCAMLSGAVLLSSCTSTSQQNTDIYSDVVDFSNRVEQLYQGMPKNKVAEVLNFPFEDRAKSLSNIEINEVICGCLPSLQSYSDVQRAADDLLITEGYSISYVDIKEHWRLRLKDTETSTIGNDITIRLVFRNDELIAWDESGGAVREKERDSHLKGSDGLLRSLLP